MRLGRRAAGRTIFNCFPYGSLYNLLISKFIYFDINDVRTSTGTRPMDQTPAPRVSSAGPTTCLRCDREFQSWDRRHNRLCPSCLQAIKEAV